MKGDTSTWVKQINAILKKNRHILEKHNPDGKARVKKAVLDKEGFNFGYHTHIYETQKGGKYYFCYEYGCLELENEMFLIVKKV